jgi:putative ABC transport system permease protein
MRLRMAWAQVRPRLGQLAAAIVMIALGVALAAGTLLANEALKKSFESSLHALAGNADLQVKAASGSGFAEHHVDGVRAVPGVVAAAPLLVGTALLPGRTDAVLRIVGVDLLDDASVRVYRGRDRRADLVDPLVFLNQPDSVMVTKSFLAERHLERGDVLAVEMPTGRRTLTIRGVLDDFGIGRAYGGNFVVMDLAAAQDFLGTSATVSQVDVRTEDPKATLAALRDALPPHLSVTSAAERMAEHGRTIAGFQLTVDGIAAMGILLAAFITANRLSTIYQARLWEIGVMRALGETPGRVMGGLLLEAAVVSSLGAVLGLPLGVVFAHLIVHPVSDSMWLNFNEIVAVPTIDASLAPLLLAAAAGILAGVLAALGPAWRGSRQRVVDVLVQGTRRDPLPEGKVRKTARIVLPLLACALLAFQLSTGSGALSGLAMIATLAAGTLLITPGLALVTRPLSPLLGSMRAIGIKDQSRFPSRASGAAALLVVGVAMALWTRAMGSSFEHFVTDRLLATRRADLIVESSFDLGADKLRLTEELLHEVSAVPGVARAGAEVNAKSLAPETGVLAVDPIRLEDERFGDWGAGVDADARNAVARGDAFLVNSQLASARGVSVGDELTITTPTGPLTRKVAGVATTSFLSQSGDVVLSRELYRDAWQDRTVTRVFVLVADAAAAEEVRTAILDRLAERYRLQVIREGDLSSAFSEDVRNGFAFTETVTLLALLVVVIGTADALAANVLERTREIGTLRSLGFTPYDIASMIVAQSIAIGVVGVGLGILVGAGMSVAFIRGLLPDLMGWQIEIHASPSLAVVVAVAGIVACVVGAAIPSIRAARLAPARALRYE